MDVRMPDGTVIKNVPEGTTQEELMSRYEALNAAPKKAAPSQPMIPFLGQSYVTPPTAQDVKSAEAIPRQGLADFMFGPAQAVAGLADIGGAAASKYGLPGSNNERMSQAVSAVRNKLAGRPGTEAGPLTGLMQGLATAPFVGPRAISSIAHGAGLGAGLAAPDQSVLAEGAKGGITAGVMNLLGRAIGNTPPRSIAERQMRDTARKENIDMTMGTASGSQMMKEVERRSERNVLLGGIGSTNYATATREGIDHQFASALWKRVGMNDDIAKKYGVEFNEFNDKTFKAASDYLGEVFQKPFQGKSLPFRGPELQLATKKADRVAKEIVEPDLLVRANELVKRKMQQGKFDASERNFLMKELRGLRERLYETDKNMNAAEAVDDLMTAINSTVVRNIKNQSDKEAYLRAMKQWSNLKIIEDVFVKSKESARGNLDFEKMKGAIERSMPGGYTYGRADLADLANLGSAMNGGSVMPEGVKFNPIDPTIYMMFNNPLSIAMRKNNPVDAAASAALLRAAGIQMNTE